MSWDADAREIGRAVGRGGRSGCVLGGMGTLVVTMIGSSLLVEDVVDGGGAVAAAEVEWDCLEMRVVCGLGGGCDVVRVDKLR